MLFWIRIRFRCSSREHAPHLVILANFARHNLNTLFPAKKCPTSTESARTMTRIGLQLYNYRRWSSLDKLRWGRRLVAGKLATSSILVTHTEFQIYKWTALDIKARELFQAPLNRPVNVASQRCKQTLETKISGQSWSDSSLAQQRVDLSFFLILALITPNFIENNTLERKTLFKHLITRLVSETE